MPAGSTYTPIATTTLGSAAASYTFSSIPSTYTDLILVFAGSSSSAAQSLEMRFNSDTGSNYSFTGLYGTGSVAGSFRTSNLTYARLCNFSTGQGNAIAHIQNYSNTTTNKTILTRSNDAGNDVIGFVNLWRSTSAITSILLQNIGGGTNIAAGSTFTLYGIASA